MTIPRTVEDLTPRWCSDALGRTITAVSATPLGVGVGLVGLGALNALGRNPEARGQIMTYMILAIAMAEAVAIYALVVAILLIFVTTK